MKVFSLLKYVESFNNIGMLQEAVDGILNGWVLECEGKTAEECDQIGYGVSDAWMVEV